MWGLQLPILECVRHAFQDNVGQSAADWLLPCATLVQGYL